MKKTISIMLAIVLIVALLVPVSASETTIVTSAEVTATGILVKGNTGFISDNVTIALLKSGVTPDELSDINSEEEFYEKVAYATVVVTDDEGKFEKQLKTKDVTEGTLLYVTNGKTADVISVTNVDTSETYTGTEYVFNFVDYRNSGVLFKGVTDVENKKFKIVILKYGYTFNDYKKDSNSSVYGEADITSDEYARFEAQIDAQIEAGKKYYAYLITEDENSEDYGKKITTLQKPVEIYVSKTRTGENVFSSIENARNYLRTNLTDTAVDVIIDGGEYNVSSALLFTSADARTTYTRVKYIAKAGEEVIISGGKKIANQYISPVTDTDVLNRVYENVKDRLVEIDLQGAGVNESIINFTDYYVKGKPLTVPYVYLNGELQTISQWPNDGFAKYTYDADNKVLTYSDLDRISRWSNAEDLYLKGYFTSTYIGKWIKVDSVTTSINVSDTDIKNNTSNNRFKAVNLLEEIDVSGEWFIDKEKSKMYYLPPHEITDADVLEIGGIKDDIIRIDGAKNITFENLTLEKNFDTELLTSNKAEDTKYSNGIEIKASDSINIQGCIIRNSAVNGVAVASGKNIWVDGCRIYNTGFDGVVVSGQNRSTLESRNYIISNCHISDVSLNGMQNYGSAIRLNSTGAIAENNIIHNVRAVAINYVGSENVIRNNEIYNASTETADSGAIYTGRRWDSVGNIIEKNYIHQIGPVEDIGKEIWYIYFDDAHAGNIARSNILIGRNKAFVNGVQLAHGPNNSINSNIFVDFGDGDGNGNNVDTSYRGGFHASMLKTLLDISNYMDVYSEKYSYLNDLLKLYKVTDASQITADSDISYFDYGSYKENNIVNNNITNKGYVVYDDGYNANGSSGKWWINNGFRNMLTGFSFTKMDITKSGNKEKTGDVFVNSAIGDYRVDTSKLSSVPEGVLTEAFDINTIGLVKTIPSVKDFGLLYPSNGKLDAETSMILSWEKSYDADSYKYYIATDENFDDIIVSGNVTTNFAEISGLDENTKYYWKVEANTSARVKENWECENIFTFSTYTDVSIDITYGDISVKNEQGEDITLTAGEIIRVTDDIISAIPASQKLVYIFAVYDKEENLLYTKINNITVTSSSSSVLILEFEMPAISGADKYKVFRWESFKNLKPIK